MLAHLEGVLEESGDDSKMTAALKRVILEQMEGRYGDDSDTIRRMMRKATLLDPRYRGDHMKSPELQSTKSEMMEEIVADCSVALAAKYTTRYMLEKERDQMPAPPPFLRKKRHLWAAFLGREQPQQPRSLMSKRVSQK